MIEIHNIVKSFGSKEVLKGISARFEAGKVNIIIGGSGTGKSVLLKSLIGLLPPDNGDVLYDGRSFYQSSTTEQQEIRREMGVLFQGGALFDSQTVAQNVRFPLDMLTTMPENEKKERVDFCLQRVGLASSSDRMPSEISGGMKKRVGIARAIVMNPKYLFCDEPNSGLDPLTAAKIDELIKEITEEYKTTTVIITHDMNSVLEIGQHINFLYQGYKLWDGKVDDMFKTGIEELNEFLYATKLIREMK